jgi:hypothetical protein
VCVDLGGRSWRAQIYSAQPIPDPPRHFSFNVGGGGPSWWFLSMVPPLTWGLLVNSDNPPPDLSRLPLPPLSRPLTTRLYHLPLFRHLSPTHSPSSVCHISHSHSPSHLLTCVFHFPDMSPLHVPSPLLFFSPPDTCSTSLHVTYVMSLCPPRPITNHHSLPFASTSSPALRHTHTFTPQHPCILSIMSIAPIASSLLAPSMSTSWVHLQRSS